jgi:hypothetical protein
MSTVITDIDAFLDALEKGATDSLYLQLNGTKIGDAGATRLAEALSTAQAPRSTT